MGTEIIIALGALIIAIVAFSLTQAQSRKVDDTARLLRKDHSDLTDELSGRLAKIGERFQEQTGEGEQLRQLKATVKVLELRVLEHDALLCCLVTEDEAHHLWNVSRDEPTMYQRHPGVEGELRSLVRRGLLKKQGDFKIHELPQEFDLHDRFALTDSGEMLLALRKHLQVADSRPQESLPPPAPDSSVRNAPSIHRSAPPPFVRPTGTNS